MPNTSSLGEELLRRHGTESCHSTRPLIIITAHMFEEDDPEERRCLRFDLLFDSKNDERARPCLLSRDVVFDSKDDLETMLESYFPDVDPTTRNPVFPSAELERLLKAIINAILYATFPGVIRGKHGVAGCRPATQEKQTRQIQADQGDGPNRRDEMAFFRGASVFLLGKITISPLKRYKEMEKTHEGRTIMKHFMVRGHWRHANPSRKDQALRWIAPYWKGPEMAANSVHFGTPAQTASLHEAVRWLTF